MFSISHYLEHVEENWIHSINCPNILLRLFCKKYDEFDYNSAQCHAEEHKFLNKMKIDFGSVRNFRILNLFNTKIRYHLKNSNYPQLMCNCSLNLKMLIKERE